MCVCVRVPWEGQASGHPSIGDGAVCGKHLSSPWCRFSVCTDLQQRRQDAKAGHEANVLVLYSSSAGVLSVTPSPAALAC